MVQFQSGQQVARESDAVTWVEPEMLLLHNCNRSLLVRSMSSHGL